MNFDIFPSLLHVFDLGKKNDDGFGRDHTEANDGLECYMINDTNSVGSKPIKRNGDLTHEI